MYKLLTLSRGSDGLSIGFERDRGRLQRECTNNEKVKGRKHFPIMLKDIFGFAEHQEKATFGLGYRLILTRNSDNVVLNEGNAINNGKIKINSIDSCIPHCRPSIEQQRVLRKQIVDKTPTELRYPKRSVFMKEVNTQKLRSFQLGTQEGINVTIGIYTAFQQSDRQHDQNLNNDTFVGLPNTSAQCSIGTEIYPDVGFLSIYDDGYYSQGYGQIKKAFRALTKEDILQPYINEDDFTSSNDANDFGYNIHSFDIR